VNSVAVKLESVYGRLAGVEKQIADYITTHTNQVPLLTVEQIAQQSGGSVATVSRFVKKLGYPSLRAFKIELARAGSEEEDRLFHGINPGDSDNEIIQKTFLGNRKSLEDSLALLDQEKMIECVKALAEQDKLLFFGIGSSGFLVRDAAMRFRFLGFQAAAYTDPAEITFNAASADDKTGVIAVSHSGRTVLTVEAAIIAGKRGSTTVGITNYPGSPLTKACGYNFYTSFPETAVRVAALSGRVAQLCIIDALYLLIARYRSTSFDLKSISELTDSLLRQKAVKRR
jgi:DNA-binding MurR/RpiR family transcriptional regulator